jgi:hypothetical protein
MESNPIRFEKKQNQVQCRMSQRNPFSLFMALAGLAFVFALTPLATATEPMLTSPEGFSITPPDGWTVVSKTTAQQAAATIQKRFPSLGSIDFDKMAVIMLNPADFGATNINVVVAPARLPISAPGIEEKLADKLREQFMTRGISLAGPSVTRRTFGSHATLVADLQWALGRANIRQWQVAAPTGSRTLIITCTSRQATFATYEPVFTEAIASMKFPSSFDFSLPTVIYYGIGGLVLLYALLNLPSSTTSTRPVARRAHPSISRFGAPTPAYNPYDDPEERKALKTRYIRIGGIAGGVLVAVLSSRWGGANQPLNDVLFISTICGALAGLCAGALGWLLATLTIALRSRWAGGLAGIALLGLAIFGLYRQGVFHPALLTTNDVVQPPPAPSAVAPPEVESVVAAQQEAVKRYPQLGVVNSPLNREFVTRYKQLQATNPDYFKQSNWPLTLAAECEAAVNQTPQHRNGKPAK